MLVGTDGTGNTANAAVTEEQEKQAEVIFKHLANNSEKLQSLYERLYRFSGSLNRANADEENNEKQGETNNFVEEINTSLDDQSRLIDKCNSLMDYLEEFL